MRPPLKKSWPPQLNELLTDCWQEQSSLRPSMQEARSQPLSPRQPMDAPPASHSLAPSQVCVRLRTLLRLIGCPLKIRSKEIADLAVEDFETDANPIQHRREAFPIVPEP